MNGGQARLQQTRVRRVSSVYIRLLQVGFQVGLLDTRQESILGRGAPPSDNLIRNLVYGHLRVVNCYGHALRICAADRFVHS